MAKQLETKCARTLFAYDNSSLKCCDHLHNYNLNSKQYYFHPVLADVDMMDMIATAAD